MSAYGVKKRGGTNTHIRIRILRVSFLCVLGLFAARLFFLQVLQGPVYKVLAEGQHGFYKELFAQRGNILVRDWADGGEYAIAATAPNGFVYADPRRVKDPESTALVLARILGYTIPEAAPAVVTDPVATIAPSAPSDVQVDQLVNRLTSNPAIDEAPPTPVVDAQGIVAEDPFIQYHTLLTRLLKKDDPYEPIQRGVREDVLKRIDAAKLSGIYYVDELGRTYPEGGMGGQLMGFLGMNDTGDRVGLYGVEGYHEDFLKGKNGYLASVTDPSGQWIGVGGRAFEHAQDGGDLLLTIDRTIQYEACQSIKQGVADSKSDSGSITVMEPETGRIIAMCAFPNFEPENYAEVESARTFQNPSVGLAYEPGSVMKPLIMAAALDKKVLTPQTTFTDSGEEKIDKYTIRNSDLKANGLQTMTQVLEKSLNTGMIFVMRKLGFDSFQSYVKQYGFGERTGIELAGEVTGTIDALDIKSEIYYATASFGQGITVTPIQLATAYSAIANGGYLMRPYVVEEKRYSTGVVETTHPKVVRQVLSESAAQQAAAMMVSVVEKGHAHTAAIPAYYVAGKTGTAQVPKDDGAGYRLDTSRATFAGFAPLDHPQFTMIVMLDHPRTSQWADSTASPIWKHMAEFMLQYFEVTPERTL